MGLSCLNELLGRSRGDGRGCIVGSGVVARGGGEEARRDIEEYYWRRGGEYAIMISSEGGL